MHDGSATRAAVAAATLVAAAAILFPLARSAPSTEPVPAATRPTAEADAGLPGVRIHYLLEPLDRLLSYDDETVVVAVVRVVDRTQRTVPLAEIGRTQNAVLSPSTSGRMRTLGIEDAPLTAVTLERIEGLKGDLPDSFEVWERRGSSESMRIDSEDPMLEQGQTGMLLAGRLDGKLVPLIFSRIDDRGYLTDYSLNMTLDALRTRIARNAE